MLNRIVISAIVIFILGNTCNAQTRSNPESFNQEDWDKLSKTSRDSINKVLLIKFEEARKKAALADEIAANIILDEALKNINGTTTLSFNAFPKAGFREEVSKFKNLESFTCTKCRQLDLNLLFNQLAQLPKLRHLNLSGGAFKTLPNSIRKLTQLQELNLKDNNFVTFPDSIIYLKNLQVLNLEHNAYLYDDEVFEKIMPMNIEELNFASSGLLELSDKIGLVKSLKIIDLSVNDIRVMPPSFSLLINLQEIRLAQNLNLDLNQVISSISSFTTLFKLDLAQCMIENLPPDIAKLTSLKNLILRGNHLNTLPITFGNLSNLEYLDLGYFEMGTRMNKISELGPGFVQLKKLKNLNLAGNQLKTLPEGFSGLAELTDLNLSLNKLQGFPQSLTELKKLKSLDLSLNEGGSIPSTIANLTDLEYLNLDGNYFNHPDKKIKTLPDEICQLNNLKTLSLQDNVIEQLPACIGSMSRLEKLNLRDNLLSSFPPSFTRLSHLKWLDLKANDFNSLPEDLAKLGALKELNLSMNIKMNFESEKNKLTSMSQLEFLDMSYNNITKDQITPLRNSLSKCKVINWDYSNQRLSGGQHKIKEER